MTSRRDFLGIATAGSALAAGDLIESRPGAAAPETGTQSGAGERTPLFISGSPRYNYGKTSWDIPRKYIEKREKLRAVAARYGVDEEHRVLRSFIRDGLEGGEKGFHIVDPDLRDEYLRRLAGAGINVERAIATGQLEVRPWQEAYLRGDCFNQDAMLALIKEVLQSGAATGYPLTRLLAHMEWALLDALRDWRNI